MVISLFVLWALTGWCGNEPLILWFPLPPPVPERPPRPNWLVLRIIGMVFGVIGGFVFSRVFGPGPEPWLAAGPQPEPWGIALFAAATAVGAFVAARFVTDIYGQLTNRRLAERVGS
jgi:hypothetical protein